MFEWWVHKQWWASKLWTSESGGDSCCVPDSLQKCYLILKIIVTGKQECFLLCKWQHWVLESLSNSLKSYRGLLSVHWT